MLILALDSTALAASVAVTEDERLLAHYHLNNGNTHSETLLPMVESIMTRLGLGIDAVDLFACSVGPGSFTGVRIGAATIKGLAFGKKQALCRRLHPRGTGRKSARRCPHRGAHLPRDERPPRTGIQRPLPRHL